MSEQRLREGARAFAEKVFNDIREFSKDPVIRSHNPGSDFCPG